MRLPRIPLPLPLLALGIAATGLAYWPGLSGGFLFDDSINLRAIGQFGPVDDWRTLLYYLTSGTADPTGRPISLLSFLIDARSWPADPWPFKRTNVLLHLLNGALLAVALWRFEQHLDADRDRVRTAWVATLGAMLWIAHPLHVSTVLYIVQRHAMLPLTFTLLGLLAWERAWQHAGRGSRVSAWMWGLAGAWVCTLLAGLSKANGFLLAWLLLAATVTVLSRASAYGALPRPKPRMLAWALLGPPCVAVLVMLAQSWPRSLDWQPYHRDWTIGERLLSQPRALMDYLGSLLLPRQSSGGIFVEGFEVSRSWLDPWTTAPAFLAVAALLVAGVLLRSRLPRLSFAILFFFVAHVVESSFIGLELYFEHRNYLPSAFLFWPVANWLVRASHLFRLRIILAVALPVLLAGLTYSRASLWGDPALQAELWGQRNDSSARSQIIAAQALADSGRTLEAFARMQNVIQAFPDDASVALAALALECRRSRASPRTLEHARAVLGEQRLWPASYFQLLGRLLDAADTSTCRGLDADQIDQLFASIEANPHSHQNDVRRSAWYNLQGRRLLARGDQAGAVHYFSVPLEHQATPELLLVTAAQLGNAGFPSLGLDLLRRFRGVLEMGKAEPIRSMREVHTAVLRETGYFERELEALEQALAAAAAQSGPDNEAATERPMHDQ